MIKLIPYILFTFLGTTNAAQELILNETWGKITESCETEKPAPYEAIVIKQWHLAPSVQTKDIAKSKTLPQAANQRAIYDMLKKWIDDGISKTLIVEGCEKEMTAQFKDKFNGWSYNDLLLRLGLTDYPDIQTHVGLKLKAEMKDQLKVLCGDNSKLINEHNLVFSDLRGLEGFRKRLTEFRDQPAKAKGYLEAVVKINKLPPKTTVAQALVFIKDKFEEELKKAEILFGQRNDSFVKAIKSHKQTAFVVIGGLHVKDLKNKLEKENIGCQIVEPAGYKEFD